MCYLKQILWPAHTIVTIYPPDSNSTFSVVVDNLACRAQCIVTIEIGHSYNDSAWTVLKVGMIKEIVNAHLGFVEKRWSRNDHSRGKKKKLENDRNSYVGEPGDV